MTLVSTEPRPCTDPGCRGQHAPAERVALAMSLCGARGAQLTDLRRQVLELFWESGRPTVELEDRRLAGAISEDADLIGFRPTRRMIEVEGVCATCIAAGAA